MKKLLKYLQLLIGNPAEPEYIEMSKATLREVILAVEERDELRRKVDLQCREIEALKHDINRTMNILTVELTAQKNDPQPDEPAAG